MRQVGELVRVRKNHDDELPQQSIQFHSCARTSVFFLAASVCSVLVPAANSISVSSLKTTQDLLAAPLAFSESGNNYLSHLGKGSEAEGETGGETRTQKQGVHAITAAAGSHFAEDTGWWTFS